ncbi:hypothetical protein V2J09_008809 [Rumex salicifolius]
MDVEVSGSDHPHENGKAKVEESMPNLQEKENGKVHSANGFAEKITFGTHGIDESRKLEVDNASDLPKNAVDEWPAEPQIHSFYLVRYRPYDDPNLKAKIDLADKEIGKKNQQRFQVLEGLKAKRSDRAQIIGQLKSLGVENRQYGQAMDEKINQIKPLKEALGSLRGSNNAGREGAGLCSSEGELNDLIRSLSYRMQHEVIPLTEEKQILRDIKQLEGTREKVIANAAMRAKIQESLGQKDAINDQVKLMGTDLDGVKKDRQAVRSKMKVLEDELKAVDSDITSLQEELASITEKRDKAFETIHQLRKQRDEVNSSYHQNRTLLNNAKELAAKKNIKGLKELACPEVDKFMSSWNSSKAFRDDYEKRILTSLDMRQLSRDGRMRNPNEKPLVSVEQTKPVEPQTFTKPAPKIIKEDVKPPKEEATVPAQKDVKKIHAVVSEPQNVEEEEYYEREKKLRKKKGMESTLSSNQDEATEIQVEEEEKSDKLEQEAETQISVKSKETKANSTKARFRGQANRRNNALPKAILRRKKSNNYWVWAALGAALFAVLLALLFKYAL